MNTVTFKTIGLKSVSENNFVLLFCITGLKARNVQLQIAVVRTKTALHVCTCVAICPFHFNQLSIILCVSYRGQTKTNDN